MIKPNFTNLNGFLYMRINIKLRTELIIKLIPLTLKIRLPHL